MTWDELFNLFQSKETLHHFSLKGLPLKRNGVGASPAITFLSLPFARSVLVDAPVPETLLRHFDSVQWGPEQIETSHSLVDTAHRYQTSFTLTPSFASEQSKDRSQLSSLPSAVFDLSWEAYQRIFKRQFLLLECAQKLPKKVPNKGPVIPAVAFSPSLNQTAHQVWTALAARDGVLMRSDLSVQGDQITSLHSVEQLDAALDTLQRSCGGVPPTSILFSRLFSPDEYEKDLELSIGIKNGKATLLGYAEQKSRNWRHYGCTTLSLPPETEEALTDFTRLLGPPLEEAGFRSGVIGVDGFLIQSPQGFEFKAYDLNPCVSQAFFALALREKLKRHFSRPLEVSTLLLSLFIRPGTKPRFEWHHPEIVPMLYSEYGDANAAYERVVILVAGVDEKDPVATLAAWVKKLKDDNRHEILKLHEMFF